MACKNHMARRASYVCVCRCVCLCVCVCLSQRARLYLYRICLGSVENDTVILNGLSTWTLTQLTILTGCIKPSVRVRACLCVFLFVCECCSFDCMVYAFQKVSVLLTAKSKIHFHSSSVLRQYTLSF